jgi:hypothetical protein
MTLLLALCSGSSAGQMMTLEWISSEIISSRGWRVTAVLTKGGMERDW